LITDLIQTSVTVIHSGPFSTCSQT